MHGEQRPLPGSCRYPSGDLSGAEPSPLQIEGWQGWRQPPSSVGEQAAKPSRRSPVPTSEPDVHPAAPCPHRQSGRGFRRISSSGSTAVLRIARSRRYALAVIETDTPWSNRRRRHDPMPNRRRGAVSTPSGSTPTTTVRDRLDGPCLDVLPDRALRDAHQASHAHKADPPLRDELAWELG